MRDDELGRLVRRSLEGHADDVRPSPDLGEWVVERGKVVRRRRRVTAMAGAGTTLALVVGAAVLVPRLADGQDPEDKVVPATPPTSQVTTAPAIPSPTPTSTGTSAPEPTSEPPSVPRSTATSPTDVPSATATATRTAPTSTPTASGTLAPEPGSSFETPFGPVAFPTGTSVKIAGTRAGDRYLALVGSNDDQTDSAPPNQARLMSVASDGTAIVIASAGNGSAHSFATSPNGRFVVVAIHDDGGERLEAYRVGQLGERASYIVPEEWQGEIVGWATEGVTIKGTQSAHELTWQMDSGRVTVRPAPDAPPTTLVTGR